MIERIKNNEEKLDKIIDAVSELALTDLRALYERMYEISSRELNKK